MKFESKNQKIVSEAYQDLYDKDLKDSKIEKIIACDPRQGQSDEVAKRVLLVEDSPVIAMANSLLLKRFGYQVELAEDGEKAIKLFKHHEYDLVIMDLGLPKIDGLAATRVIRILEDGKQRRTPIMVLTAMDKDLKDTCLEAGADDYATKPLAGEAFKLRTESLLNKPLNID